MEASEIKPGTITYGIMFRGYGHLKNCTIPLQLYEKMKVQGVPMNEITFGCLIDACKDRSASLNNTEGATHA